MSGPRNDAALGGSVCRDLETAPLLGAPCVGTSKRRRRDLLGAPCVGTSKNGLPSLDLAPYLETRWTLYYYLKHPGAVNPLPRNTKPPQWALFSPARPPPVTPKHEPPPLTRNTAPPRWALLLPGRPPTSRACVPPGLQGVRQLPERASANFRRGLGNQWPTAPLGVRLHRFTEPRPRVPHIVVNLRKEKERPPGRARPLVFPCAQFRGLCTTEKAPGPGLRGERRGGHCTGGIRSGLRTNAPPKRRPALVSVKFAGENQCAGGIRHPLAGPYCSQGVRQLPGRVSPQVPERVSANFPSVCPPTSRACVQSVRSVALHRSPRTPTRRGGESGPDPLARWHRRPQLWPTRPGRTMPAGAAAPALARRRRGTQMGPARLGPRLSPFLHPAGPLGPRMRPEGRGGSRRAGRAAGGNVDTQAPACSWGTPCAAARPPGARPWSVSLVSL